MALKPLYRAFKFKNIEFCHIKCPVNKCKKSHMYFILTRDQNRQNAKEELGVSGQEMGGSDSLKLLVDGG